MKIKLLFITTLLLCSLNCAVYAKNLHSSDYIVNSNNFIWGDYWKLKKLPKNFKVYHELLVDDILVATLYKRIDSQ